MAWITLRDLRERADCTQEELGVKLGLAKTTICTLDASLSPTVRSLTRYVEALGGKLSLRVVMGDEAFELVLGEEAQAARKAAYYSRVHRVRRRI